MSKTTIAILFAAIGIIVAATYFELPYFGGGVGVLLVAALSYAFVVAKRELALVTYVLTEDQIIEDERDEFEGETVTSTKPPAQPGSQHPPQTERLRPVAG